MAAHRGHVGSFRWNALPSTMPIATPIASHKPMWPARTPATAPRTAPSARPNPVCFDLFSITYSRRTTELRSVDRVKDPVPHELGQAPAGPRDPSLLLRRIARFGGFVADLPHLAQQLGERHAREGFEQRRHLRRHLGDVAGDLVHPGSIAISR